ncbi:MAG: hypothetical protein QOG04_41 [Actinomycetota bacterium]|jgi:hypothetical protein|nr:hypothetical protein [Actinomycetota bacterium]
MEALANRRRGPFIVIAALFVAICIVVISVPDSVLALIERNRPLTSAQAGWAYRLLAFFAIIQIVYTGMSVFRIERLESLREKDDRFAKLPKPKVISSLARNAAALVSFTLIYGIASMLLTGQRGGFWLFPLLAVAQAAWYYREIGQIADWKAFQADETQNDSDHGRWISTQADYCPPLTRGLTPLEGATTTVD